MATRLQQCRNNHTCCSSSWTICPVNGNQIWLYTWYLWQLHVFMPHSIIICLSKIFPYPNQFLVTLFHRARGSDIQGSTVHGKIRTITICAWFPMVYMYINICYLHIGDDKKVSLYAWHTIHGETTKMAPSCVLYNKWCIIYLSNQDDKMLGLCHM